jgi:hypothetical protein
MKEKKGPWKPGFKMDFKADSDRPVLVDFVGGKRYKGTTTAFDEETAVEALILAPDGKLTVLNSRAGTDAVQEQNPHDPTIQTSRQDRVISARQRFQRILHGGSPDPMNPKLPGPKGLGGQNERGGG